MIGLLPLISHPTLAELEAAARQVLDWALNHYATLPDQLIGTFASAREMRQLLHEPPPEHGHPFETILHRFHEQIASHAFRTNHPRFLAFVPGAPSFPSILGDWMCAAANFFAGVWLEAAGPSQIEVTVLDWLKEWIGYPPTASGILTGGGSEATLTALAVARDRIPFDDRRRAVLYVCEQRHWSVDRAAKILGLHPDQLHPLPVGEDLRLHGDALRDAVARDRCNGRLPWAVVANAGATNTGTVDNLPSIATVAREESLWLHIDAAYGWAAILTEEGQQELQGIAEADSVTLDPHKWFAQTFEAGCVLIQDGPRLAQTFMLRPEYMQDVEPEPGEVNFADHGIALTRRFRALKIWVSVQMLGLNWFRELALDCMQLADYAQQRLEQAGCFEILCPRRLSIVCFRYVSPKQGDDLDGLNTAIQRELVASGRAFLSSTRLQGKYALRMCFINWRTRREDVEEIVQRLVEIGERLSTK